MRGIRTFTQNHRALAALVLALVLSIRLLVPAGYMIAADSKVLTVVICTGTTGDHQTAQLVIPQKDQKPGQGGNHDSGKGDPCPYSSLSMASTAGADAPLLAAALLFILALGFAPIVALARERTRYLLPPLRGPPVIA